MKDFDKIIGRNALTLVDFFATWCGPCQAMHPVIDRIRRELNGRVDICKIDIDSMEDAAVVRRYNIRSVPTFILFREGRELWRESGRLSFEQLRGALEQAEENFPVNAN